MVKTETPLLRLYKEVINQGMLDVIDELYVRNYINHISPFDLSGDVTGLKQLFKMFSEAFPDQSIVVDELYVIGDTVIARWTLKATHKGTFMGVPATNRKIVMTGVDIEKMRDGRIAEHFGAEDMLGLLQQIGGLPQLGTAQMP